MSWFLSKKSLNWRKIKMLQLKIRNFFLIVSLIALFTMVLIVPVGVIQADVLNDDTTEEETEETIETDDIDDGEDDETKMEKNGNQVKLSSGDFQIEVNAKGQVPFYHFKTSKDDVRFFLKFQRMTQFQDVVDENGVYNGVYDKGEEIGAENSHLQLPSVNWTLVVVTDEDTEKEFIFRSTEIMLSQFKDTTIELINHFTAGSTYLKFDINITNWPFEEEATGLSLEFELTWSKGSNKSDGMDLKKETNETAIYLRNDDGTLLAFFESASDVEIDGESITDGAVLFDTASANASKANILINYPWFDETLFHDPKIGTSNDAIVPLNLSAIAQWIDEYVKDGFLAVTVMATLILGALVVLSRRYQK